MGHVREEIRFNFVRFLERTRFFVEFRVEGDDTAVGFVEFLVERLEFFLVVGTAGKQIVAILRLLA